MFKLVLRCVWDFHRSPVSVLAPFEPNLSNFFSAKEWPVWRSAVPAARLLGLALGTARVRALPDRRPARAARPAGRSILGLLEGKNIPCHRASAPAHDHGSTHRHICVSAQNFQENALRQVHRLSPMAMTCQNWTNQCSNLR